MARADLTVTEINRNGVDEVTALEAANVDGQMILNNGATFIVVENGSGGDVVVTIQAQQSVHGLELPDLAVTVSNGEREFIGPFPRDTFNVRSGSDAGKLYIDFDVVTSVTVAAFRLVA